MTEKRITLIYSVAESKLKALAAAYSAEVDRWNKLAESRKGENTYTTLLRLSRSDIAAHLIGTDYQMGEADVWQQDWIDDTDINDLVLWLGEIAVEDSGRDLLEHTLKCRLGVDVYHQDGRLRRGWYRGRYHWLYVPYDLLDTHDYWDDGRVWDLGYSVSDAIATVQQHKLMGASHV